MGQYRRTGCPVLQNPPVVSDHHLFSSFSRVIQKFDMCCLLILWAPVPWSHLRAFRICGPIHSGVPKRNSVQRSGPVVVLRASLHTNSPIGPSSTHRMVIRIWPKYHISEQSASGVVTRASLHRLITGSTYRSCPPPEWSSMSSCTVSSVVVVLVMCPLLCVVCGSHC